MAKIECAFDLSLSDSCIMGVYHSETWVLNVKISLQRLLRLFQKSSEDMLTYAKIHTCTIDQSSVY